MAQEIERKFLVKGDYKSQAASSSRVCQGYICRDGNTVRVRTRDDKGYLTIKGPSEDGISRFEWETEIPPEDAEMLLQLCGGSLIDKTRWLVPYEGHVFEVDEFYGNNEGLTLAEVELSSADECFSRPAWLGKEVTGNKNYYNSYLIDYPYSKWKEEDLI